MVGDDPCGVLAKMISVPYFCYSKRFCWVGNLEI